MSNLGKNYQYYISQTLKKLTIRCTVIPQADIGVKLKFWNFEFWLAVIENSDYVDHGTDFIFFQLPKMSSPEPFKVGQICTFWHFHLKMAKICHQNIKLKYVPEKRFSWNFFWSMNIYLICYEKSFVKIASREHL